MAKESQLLEKIQRLTNRLDELEKSENDATPSSSLAMVQLNNVKAKPDNYSDGSWNEWISHFKLCAEINKWDDTQHCQQLAVSLRGRAQRIFLTLREDGKLCFDDLEKALQSRIQPEQQRKIHKLTFNARRRKSGENIVDLATDLRQLAALAYQSKDASLIEEELVDQFIRALDTKELRVGVSQPDPNTLDEAVKLALRLESIHLTEKESETTNATKINMAEKQAETAGLNMAGAEDVDETAPKWAKKFFDRQAEVLEKMSQCIVDKSTPRQRKTNIQCFKCGKYGHIARECQSYPMNQGNANRAGTR